MPDQEANEENQDEKVQVWAATSSPNDFLKRTEEVPGIPYEFVFHSDYLKMKERLEAEIQKWVDENNLLHMDKSELLRDIATLKKEVEGFRSFKESVDEALNSGDGSYQPMTDIDAELREAAENKYSVQDSFAAKPGTQWSVYKRMTPGIENWSFLLGPFSSESQAQTTANVFEKEAAPTRPLLSKRDAEIVELKELVSTVNGESLSLRVLVLDKSRVAALYCSTSVYRAIRQQLATARKDSERLREALQFYADEANYDDDAAPGTQVWASGVCVNWDLDGGAIARQAIDAEGTASEASKEPT